MIAAVSMNGPEVASKSGNVATSKSISCSCSVPSPFCRLISLTPGTSASRPKRRKGTER